MDWYVVPMMRWSCRFDPTCGSGGRRNAERNGGGGGGVAGGIVASDPQEGGYAATGISRSRRGGGASGNRHLPATSCTGGGRHSESSRRGRPGSVERQGTQDDGVRLLVAGEELQIAHARAQNTPSCHLATGTHPPQRVGVTRWPRWSMPTPGHFRRGVRPSPPGLPGKQTRHARARTHVPTPSAD